MSRPWGIHVIGSMMGSADVQTLNGQLGWVRAIPTPYHKNLIETIRAAWWVLTGKAEAVVWPKHGEIDLLLASELAHERNRCASIAARHLNMVGGNGDAEHEHEDLVSRGYANASHNILMEIAGPRFEHPSKAKPLEAVSQ